MDNLEQILKLANILQAIIVALVGFVDLSSGFGQALQGLFMIAFGGVIGALEITDIVQPLSKRYASFLYSFLGRGVFSVFLGTLIGFRNALSILATLYLMLLGAAYIAISFVPSIEPPNNMHEAGIDDFSDDEIEGIV